MKINKKFLLALITASCMTASVFGLAACDNQTPVKPNPPPDGTTTDKADLNDGLNTVTFTADNAEKGILYTYTAAAAGTYAFAIGGDGASVKVNGTAVTSYVAELTKGAKVEFVCASATDENASYSVYAGKAEALTAGSANSVAIPASDTYSMFTVSVETAGTYRLEFSNNLSADFSLLINSEITSATWYNNWTPIVTLAAGQNVMVLTSSISGNSIGDNKVSITIAEHGEIAAKPLILGANEITLNADEFYNGIEYTFTAPEKGLYKLSTTDSEALILDESGFNAILEGESSTNVALEKDEVLTVFCASLKEEGDSHTYTLAIAKTESSNVVEIGDESGQLILVNNKVATIKVTAPTAGNYNLLIFGVENRETVTIKVGNGTPITVTATIMGMNARAFASIALPAAETEITVELSSTTNAIEVVILVPEE